jgi:putative transposase
MLTPHASYLKLGSTPRERQAHYRTLIAEQLDAQTIEELRQYTQQQRVWGSERFQQQIENLTQRRAKIRPRGRPKSHPTLSKNEPEPKFLQIFVTPVFGYCELRLL